MLSPSSPAAEGREVPRTALLERLANARARIVLLSAPAGFGKTTLALQFARQSPAFALCDCADLSSEVELATRLVAALARESNGVNAGFLMQCQLALGTPTVPLNERLALAVEAWRNTKNEATFVLENAEALAGDRDAIRFVTHLMSTMPEARRLIVCSRTSLPIRFGRFAAPERLLTLRADDLAFTSSELSGVFALAGVPSELAERAGTL
ncbi:MAG TPA: AAA family ATPase, partial [Candidatus Baltobacteraceae bacterium]|nr:AAA family ATPase [Candidatus Baltobacteraceae bacterium]